MGLCFLKFTGGFFINPYYSGILHSRILMFLIFPCLYDFGLTPLKLYDTILYYTVLFCTYTYYGHGNSPYSPVLLREQLKKVGTLRSRHLTTIVLDIVTYTTNLLYLYFMDHTRNRVLLINHLKKERRGIVDCQKPNPSLTRSFTLSLP